MVLIPGGSFQMGDHLDKMSNALPVHKVKLDGFYMDSHQITVGQFKRFLKESGYKPEAVKGGWEINRFWNEVEKYLPADKHPVIYVSWNDATAYAKWAGNTVKLFNFIAETLHQVSVFVPVMIILSLLVAITAHWYDHHVRIQTLDQGWSLDDIGILTRGQNGT